jgi:hypothetical protein
MPDTHAAFPNLPWRRAATPVSQEEVLEAIQELSIRYRGPSTSLITWHLARGGAVTATFQSGVRDALQGLLASGRVQSVMHRGTHRWTVPVADAPAPDVTGTSGSSAASR